MNIIYYLIFTFWLSLDTMPAAIVLPGTPCAKEGCTLERKQGMFYQRDQVWPGLVCTKDHSLYIDPANPPFQNQ